MKKKISYGYVRLNRDGAASDYQPGHAPLKPTIRGGSSVQEYPYRGNKNLNLEKKGKRIICPVCKKVFVTTEVNIGYCSKDCLDGSMNGF